MEFTSISYDTIKKFILDNNETSTNENKDYTVAKRMVQNRDYKILPGEIEDYFISRQILRNKINIPKWRSSLILTETGKQMKLLSNQLMLKDPNRIRMMRILAFLNKLNYDGHLFYFLNYDIWPIITSYLSNESIRAMALI